MSGEAKKVVVVGFAGSQLDRAEGGGRWEKWRPTVALGQFEDLRLDRLDLIVPPKKMPWVDTLVDDFSAVSPETDICQHPLRLQDPWDFDEVFTALLDLSVSLDLQPESQDVLVNITTGTHVAQICLFLLTEAGYLPGRLLQLSPPKRRGSRRAQSAAAVGPGGWNAIDLDLSRYDHIATRFRQEQLEAKAVLKSGIATRNERFNRLIDRIEQVALRSTDPILLAGPTGAGKSWLAQRIYELRRSRAQLTGAFVEVNCATLRGDGAMAALFGHTAGAFTGAVKARQGLLRTAHGGLLFLDEIGELGLDEQAMLLRAIEEKRFLPVGSDREVESDFQLIAGSNRDLRRACRTGNFRDDLLARIDLWTFRLPGLAERLEDIEPNLDFELGRLERELSHRVTINREARELFLTFATGPDATWSGNFRDLNAAVRRMATLAPEGRIDVPTVREELDRLRQGWAHGPGDAPASPGAAAEAVVAATLGADRASTLDRFELVQLADVLRVCGRCRSLAQAGRELFARSRERRKAPNDADRLRKYLLRFGLRGRDVLAG